MEPVTTMLFRFLPYLVADLRSSRLLVGFGVSIGLWKGVFGGLRVGREKKGGRAGRGSAEGEFGGVNGKMLPNDPDFEERRRTRHLDNREQKETPLDPPLRRTSAPQNRTSSPLDIRLQKIPIKVRLLRTWHRRRNMQHIIQILSLKRFVPCPLLGVIGDVDEGDLVLPFGVYGEELVAVDVLADAADDGMALLSCGTGGLVWCSVASVGGGGNWGKP